MSFIDEMANLRNAIDETREKTAVAVEQTRKDAKRIRHGAQELVREFAARQKANAKKLREELKNATQKLETEVKEIRGNNISEQKRLRKEFTQAKAAFWGKGSKAPSKKGGQS